MRSDSREELSTRDAQAIVDYLDGVLQGAELEAFEARAAGDPALARALEGFLEGDLLMHGHASIRALRSARPRPFLLRPTTLAVLAVAAQVVVVVSLWTSLSEPSQPEPARPWATAAASFKSFDDYQGAIPELSGLRPPLDKATRGGAEPPDEPNISSGEFLELSNGLLRHVEGAPETLRANHFRVPVDLDRGSDVLIVGLPEVGGARWLFPEFSAGIVDQRSTRFARGRHWLPAPPVSISPTGSDLLAYDNGIVVRIKEKALQVVVAARAIPLEEEELRRIAARVERGDPAGVMQVLRELRFRITRFEVRATD